MSSQRTTKLSLSRTQKKPENQGKINSFFDVKPKTANDVKSKTADDVNSKTTNDINSKAANYIKPKTANDAKSKSAQNVKHQTSSFAYDVEKEEESTDEDEVEFIGFKPITPKVTR